jgi:hypothetical protein
MVRKYPRATPSELCDIVFSMFGDHDDTAEE